MQGGAIFIYLSFLIIVKITPHPTIQQNIVLFQGTTYSTTEHNIGTYFGRNLYEKTINYTTSIPAATDTVIDRVLTSSYIYDLVEMSGGAKKPLSDIVPINIFDRNSGVACYISSSGVTVYSSDNVLSRVSVTLRYTKV